MATATVTRRLVAILAADVVGYSRLMGADEEGTHERFKAYLVEVVDPKIRERRGRIVKTTGDGVLAEFASVVDAVRCAGEIQRAMADRDLDLAEERRLRFRIGVNLGDVIADGGDIYGDGVNIAARLEGLAAPGGICVSGTVRDHVGDRLPYVFEDMGEQSVKNIARPVRVYALRSEGIVGSPMAGASTTSSSPAIAAPRLSIVVLPFANLSNDLEQQYFADGITEDLTTDLSRLAGMLVISRNTAFTYRNKSIDTKQISRELGVRYVLEGSVRRSGSQIRINAQLIDAETDTHLWAERLNGDTSDLFALQDEITSRIAVTLGYELVRAEAARPSEQPEALDYILRARAAMLRGAARENTAEAIGLFERGLALDPRSIEAKSRLASALVQRGLYAAPDAERADFERAEALINQALAVSPQYPLAHEAKGVLFQAQRRCEDAIPEFEMVLAVDRNAVGALVNLGWCKFLTGGSGDEAIQLIEQAIRLSPRDPSIAARYFRIGFVHLLLSRTDQAIAWLEKARSADPRYAPPHHFLACAYGLKGELDRATAERAEAQKLTGSDRYSTIARVRANGDLNTPAVRDRFEGIFLAGLRKAGMPEE
jgi:adenylate cyclase